MANALYPKWKEQLLQFTANNNLSAGTVKVALVSAGYTYASTDQFWSAVSASSVGTPQTIGTKTFTNGVFSGGNVTFTAVTGAQVTKLVIYVDTGTASTSPLVAFLDTSISGLPTTPNGGDITITWNASGIFAL
jgi:hypothetical protein